MPNVITQYLRQFRLRDAVRLGLLHSVRRVLDPQSSTGYAREAQDRIVLGLLGWEPGFYVDVGCNDPVENSNTFELYRRGWHGLAVDASEKLIATFRRVRPRDQCAAAVVSDTERDAEFTEFALSTVSTLSAEHAAEWRRHQPVVRVRKVRTTTLTALCEAHGVPARFDLLSVDVERHDLEVLSSLDFDRFRPRLVIAEMLGCGLSDAGEHPIGRLLGERGYELAAFALDNGYFIDRR